MQSYNFSQIIRVHPTLKGIQSYHLSGLRIICKHNCAKQIIGPFYCNLLKIYEYQGRSQRGAMEGSPGPLIKSGPLVGVRRYIKSFQNKKFSNRNTLVQIKTSLASGGKAPGFLYIYIYIYIGM